MKVIEEIDLSEYSHVMKRLGTMKETLEYLSKIKIEEADGSQVQLFVKEMFTLSNSELERLEIFFGFMNDKYWYPKDMTMQEAIDSFWFDTIAVVSEDEELLAKVLELFKIEFNDKDELVQISTGKTFPSKSTVIFDEVDIYPWKERKKAVRLWMD